MSLKKYLRKQAEREAEQLLTEEDKQLCMQLAQSSVQAQAVKPRTNIWVAVCSAFAAVLLVAVVVLPITLKNKPVDDVLYYRIENICEIDCSLEDVNNNLNYFNIDISTVDSYYFWLNYDSISNDKLYYTAHISTFIIDIDFYIIVNNKFDFDFKINGELINRQLDDYFIDYEIVDSDSLIGDSVKYKGIVKSDYETVYIEYTQSFDLGEQAFFDEIQSILKLKN